MTVCRTFLSLPVLKVNLKFRFFFYLFTYVFLVRGYDLIRTRQHPLGLTSLHVRISLELESKKSICLCLVMPRSGCLDQGVGNEMLLHLVHTPSLQQSPAQRDQMQTPLKQSSMNSSVCVLNPLLLLAVSSHYVTHTQFNQLVSKMVKWCKINVIYFCFSQCH